MDIQEWHITNRKYRYFGVQDFLVAPTKVCHPLLALTGETGSELASPSSCFEINALTLLHGSPKEASPYPLTYPSCISCHSGSRSKSRRIYYSYDALTEYGTEPRVSGDDRSYISRDTSDTSRLLLLVTRICPPTNTYTILLTLITLQKLDLVALNAGQTKSVSF
ncbi:hypothetical protein J6590_032104 [Homalodisca vitripennis]|nr:hypothetical protein J6590_032104 [Homalodisca vitripennis]